MAKKSASAPSQGGHAYSLERDLSQATGLPGPRKSTTRAVEYTDRNVEGLRLTLGRQGGAGPGSWSWRYVVPSEGGKRAYMRLPLGRYPLTSYAEAVAALQQAKRDRQGGVNPHAALEARAKEKAGRITFAELVESKATEYFSKKKRAREPIRLLRKHAVPAIGDLAVEDLTVQHIEGLIEGVLQEQQDAGKKGTIATSLKAALASTLKLVKRRALVRDCEFGESLPHGAPKEIFIEQPDQARAMLADAARLLPEPFGDMVVLQALTGARPLEISSLRRSNVVLNHIVPAPAGAARRTMSVRALQWGTTKNGRGHTVPLSRQAFEIVQRRLAVAGPGADAPLFPSTKAGVPLRPTRTANEFQEIRDQLDVPEGFSPHCLRKTTATLLEFLGYGAPIPSLVLNHRPKDVTGRHYALYKHLAEIADALQMLADVIAPDDRTDLEAIRPADVIDFHAEGARQ